MKKRKMSRFDVIVTIITLFLMLIVLYPLIFVISSSVSDPTMVATGKVVLLPKGFTLEGYARVFQDSKILTGYANSLFYTVFGTLINLVVTVPAGYVLTKSDMPGTGIVMKLFLFTMYFSGGLIPSFLLINSLHLYNTRLVLLILEAFSMYNCIICRSFFSSLPKELEEAAQIDGCSYLRIFVQIVLPLSKALLRRAYEGCNIYIGTMYRWFRNRIIYYYVLVPFHESGSYGQIVHGYILGCTLSAFRGNCLSSSQRSLLWQRIGVYSL